MSGGWRPHHSFATQFGERRTKHDPAGDHRERHPRRLGNERHRAACARVGLNHVHLAVRDGELHVDKAPHVEGLGNLADIGFNHRHDLGRQVLWRQRTRRVTGVNTRFFDVLHHPADQHLTGCVTDCVDVDLGGILQEAVNEHGPASRQSALATERAKAFHFCHRFREFRVVVHDAHRTSAEHVARAHEHRVTGLRSHCARAGQIGGGRPWRLGDAKTVAQRTPLLTIFSNVNRRR